MRYVVCKKSVECTISSKNSSEGPHCPHRYPHPMNRLCDSSGCEEWQGPHSQKKAGLRICEKAAECKFVNRLNGFKEISCVRMVIHGCGSDPSEYSDCKYCPSLIGHVVKVRCVEVLE